MFSIFCGKQSFSPARNEIALNQNKREKGSCSCASKIKGVSYSPVCPETHASPVRSMQEALSEVYRELTGCQRVTLNVDFDQADFIGTATLAQRGVCTPLIVKWLTEREITPPVDFFSDIQSEGGREEIMHLAVETARGNKGVIADYLDAKHFDMEAIETERAESPGLYSVSIRLEDGELHNIGLHIKARAAYADSAVVSMFDPNYGEFSFGSTKDFYEFLSPFLEKAYSGKADGTDFSAVRLVTRDVVKSS